MLTNGHAGSCGRGGNFHLLSGKVLSCTGLGFVVLRIFEPKHCKSAVFRIITDVHELETGYRSDIRSLLQSLMPPGYISSCSPSLFSVP
jgi:hypothetical protein